MGILRASLFAICCCFPVVATETLLFDLHAGADQAAPHRYRHQGLEPRSFVIPVGVRLRATCRVQYSVTCEHLVLTPERPNLYLQLADPARIVPLFSAAGPGDSTIAETTFTTAGARIVSIGVELQSDGQTEAALTLEQLRITFERSLPDDLELDAALATLQIPPASIGCSSTGRRWLRVGETELPPFALGLRAGQAGVGGVRWLRLSLNFGGRADGEPVWPWPNYFDYDVIDAALEPLARQQDALAVIDLTCRSWPEWLARDGALSELDPRWRDYWRQALRLLLAHLAAQPYADRVIGCRLAPDAALVAPDRDQQLLYVEGFRLWLRHRYADSTAALQQAWQAPELDFATALPRPRNRWHTGMVGLLRHPSAPAAIQDSQRYADESAMAHGLWLARQVKELTTDAWLVGWAGGPADFLNRGWADDDPVTTRGGLELMLSAPDLDFIELPVSQLSPGVGAGSIQNSLLLADWLSSTRKLLMLRTTVAAGAETLAQIHVLRRQFAAVLLANVGLRLDLDRRSAAAAAELPRYLEIWQGSGHWGVARASDVLVVIDPDSELNLRPDAGQALAPALRAWRRICLLEAGRLALARAGLAADIRPLAEADWDAYRLLVFFNTTHLDSAARRRLESAKADGRVLLWTWAGGLADERFISPTRQTAVTAIDVTLDPAWRRLPDTPQLPWVQVPLPMPGERPAFSPFITSADELAQPPDGLAGAQVVVKNLPGWTSIHSASPMLDVRLLRTAANLAGAHQYLDSSDLFFVNDSFMAVHTRAAGIRELRLREPGALYEIFLDQELPAAETQRFEAEGGRTYLFFRGTRAMYRHD